MSDDDTKKYQKFVIRKVILQQEGSREDKTPSLTVIQETLSLILSLLNCPGHICTTNI